jgi:hypothetical protein
MDMTQQMGAFNSYMMGMGMGMPGMPSAMYGFYQPSSAASF